MTVCPERLAASFLRDGDRVVTVQIRDDLTAIADALDSSVDGARVVALLLRTTLKWVESTRVTYLR